MDDQPTSRILIVDDDEEIVQAMSIRLSAAGYECVSACNGEDGYSRFEAGGIDLVITDVIMPTSDGFTMVEWIRQLSDVPVIVVTGYPQSEQPFLADFADIACIGKPYNSDELLALVREKVAGWTRVLAQ